MLRRAAASPRVSCKDPQRAPSQFLHLCALRVAVVAEVCAVGDHHDGERYGEAAGSEAESVGVCRSGARKPAGERRADHIGLESKGSRRLSGGQGGEGRGRGAQAIEQCAAVRACREVGFHACSVARRKLPSA